MGNFLTIKHIRIDPHTSVALIKNTVNNKKIWRFRYSKLENSRFYFQEFQDFNYSKFKDIREFEKFIKDRPLMPGQWSLKVIYNKYKYKKKNDNRN